MLCAAVPEYQLLLLQDPNDLPCNKAIIREISWLREKWQCHSTSCGGSHCYVHPKEKSHFPLSHSHFSLWAAAIVSGRGFSWESTVYQADNLLGEGWWFCHCWNTTKLSNLWFCARKLQVPMLNATEMSGWCTGKDFCSTRTCNQLQYATRAVWATPSNTSKSSTSLWVGNHCNSELATISTKYQAAGTFDAHWFLCHVQS